MRNMSFAMTTEQYEARTKTVTRRFGWWTLKPGDVVMGVKKAMGLKKGEQLEKLHPFRVVSVRKEPLNAIMQDDCVMEGFPDMTPAEFVAMLVKRYGCPPDAVCNRIEFEHLDGE